MWFHMALWFECVVFWVVALLQVWLWTSSFHGNFFEFCILTFRARSTKHWTSRQHTLWPSNRSVLADCRVEISAPRIAYMSSSKDLDGEAGSKYLSWILAYISCSIMVFKNKVRDRHGFHSSHMRDRLEECFLCQLYQWLSKMIKDFGHILLQNSFTQKCFKDRKVQSVAATVFACLFAIEVGQLEKALRFHWSRNRFAFKVDTWQTSEHNGYGSYSMRWGDKKSSDVFLGHIGEIWSL